MPKPTGPTNPLLKQTIHELRSAGYKNVHFARALAKLLSRPERIRVEVNLSKLERFAQKGDIIAVPGKVLGAGKLTKAITIAAASFSISAKEKIEAVGGKTLSLVELLKKKPKGLKIIC